MLPIHAAIGQADFNAGPRWLGVVLAIDRFVDNHSP